MEISSFWVNGAMPVQLLLVLAAVFFLFLAAQTLLTKIGRPVPAFAQAVLIPAAAYAVFKWVLYPPIPSSLLVTYMGVALIFTFFLISSTDRSWNSFKATIFDTLLGRAQGYRIARAVSVVLIPFGIGLLVFQIVRPPQIEAPVELRTTFPAPPPEITLYPPEYFQQKKP